MQDLQVGGYSLAREPSIEMSDLTDALFDEDAPQADVGGATVSVLNVAEFEKV